MGEFHGNQHTTVNEWDNDDLKQAVVSYAEEHGEPPTTDEAANDDRFPCLSTIYKYLDGSWNDLLEEAGVETGHVGTYGPEERASMLQDMREVLHSVESEYLTTRQYVEHGDYSDDSIKRMFGSWKEACERANIESGRKYGISCEGPTGETLESLRELRVARFLHDHHIDYEVHPELENTSWRGDFHLPGFDLWVEVNGFAEGERPNEADFERKLEHYEHRGMECLVVESAEELEEALRARDPSFASV